jgi:hypothetical protein
MTGRPEIEIDENELKDLMQFYPTLEETAAWFKCSPDTIERRAKAIHGGSFAEFRKCFSGKTRLMLKRKAITKALDENNDKMLTYCLRTMTDLDDREKSDNKQQDGLIRLAYTLSTLDEDDLKL